MDEREVAGRALAERAHRYADLHPVVVGLPKSGVPIAFEVARAFEAPLDVLVVSKLRAPRQPTFAIGAVAEGGTCVVNEPLARVLGIGEGELAHVKGRARDELSRSVRDLRGDFPPIDVRGRAVLMVDDALVTGATAAVAARALKDRGATRVILASPEATEEGVETVRFEVDDLVLLGEPASRADMRFSLHDVATSDEEVRRLLAENRRASSVA